MRAVLRHLPLAALLALGTAMVPAGAEARMDLVTVPARDRTELTIYNSVDLTLVREERELTFSRGRNQVQFAWAGTLIDPTSVQLDLRGATELTLMDTIYPAGAQEMVIWELEAEEDTSRTIGISYFISGISWTASYTAIANPEETHLELRQFTTVRNRSGETFERAETRVVVGEVRLIHPIRALAISGLSLLMDPPTPFSGVGMTTAAAFADLGAVYDPSSHQPTHLLLADGRANFRNRSFAAEIVRAAVSEYHILAIEGEEEIRDRWSKKLPSPPISEIPFDLSYEFDTRRHGREPVKFYKFRNIADNDLGKDPLPAGVWYVETDDGRGGLRFEGRTGHDYIPIGEEAKIELGSDGLLSVEERTLSVRRTNFAFDSEGHVQSWDEEHTVVLEIGNSRGRMVPLELTHYLDAPWEFVEVSDDSYEMVDRETVRWELELQPMERREIEYTVTFERTP